jgi:hypothetical protein
MENKQPNIINVLDRMGRKLDEIGKRVDEIMDEMDINKSSNQPQPLTQLNDKEKNTWAMDIAFVTVIVAVFLFALVSLIKHRPYLM